MAKQIELVSNTIIVIDAAATLEAVNELRKEHGDGDGGKTPVTLDQFVATTRVAEECDSDFGMIDLNIHYGQSSTRRFPNYGLLVASNGKMALAGNHIEIYVNVLVKAGKAKWHAREIDECVGALSDGAATLSLSFIPDTTTDRRGNSCRLGTINGIEGRYGFKQLPISYFSVVAG